MTLRTEKLFHALTIASSSLGLPFVDASVADTAHPALGKTETTQPRSSIGDEVVSQSAFAGSWPLSWPVITIQPHRIPSGSHARMPTKLTKIQFGSFQSPPKSTEM